MCDQVEDYGLISVIIPVYNVEQYLNQCVDSVLAQTYPKLQIILVDDGSIDNSGKICDEYANKDNRISVIHQKNAGLSEARNAGYNYAKGEFVSFIDSDDWIEKDFYHKMIGLIVRDNSDFVYCDGMSFEDSPKGYNIKQGYIRRKKYDCGDGLDVFRDLQEYRDFHCAVQMYVWKRDFLEKNQMSFYPGILYEDMLYTFKAFMIADKVSHCYDPLYQRRFRNESIVTSKLKQKNFTSAATVYKEVSRFADEEKLKNNVAVNKYIARCAYRFIDIYSKLSNKAQTDNQLYRELVDDVVAHNGYGDKALVMRCKSKLHWVAYKSLQKAAFWR